MLRFKSPQQRQELSLSCWVFIGDYSEINGYPQGCADQGICQSGASLLKAFYGYFYWGLQVRLGCLSVVYGSFSTSKLYCVSIVTVPPD